MTADTLVGVTAELPVSAPERRFSYCRSTLLADDDPRHGFAQRIGTDERALADTPVLDPARTVQTDVNRVPWAEEKPDNVHASGDVYDVGTGLVTTIIDARARK